MVIVSIGRNILVIAILALYSNTISLWANKIIPQVLKHENINKFSVAKDHDFLLSLDEAMSSAEMFADKEISLSDDQKDVAIDKIRRFLNNLTTRNSFFKPLWQEGMKNRNSIAKNSLLLKFFDSKPQKNLSLGVDESLFGSVMRDEVKKKLFFNEMCLLAKDLRVSMNAKALEEFEQWKRSQKVGAPKKMDHSVMEWFNAQMIPQGFDELVELMQKAKTVHGSLLRYMVMLERKLKIGQSDVLTAIPKDATVKFFDHCEASFLVLLRESLGMMHMFRHTIRPVVEHSFKQHNLSFDGSFLDLFFTTDSRDVIGFFKTHIKNLKDLDDVCMEFLVFGQDLLVSFSPSVVHKYNEWKKVQESPGAA